MGGDVMDGSTILTTSTLTVDANELRNAVAFVRQAVERWNTIPVIGMLRLMTVPAGDGHALHLTGTDLDIQLETTIPADLTGPDLSTTIAPTLLLQMIRWHDGPVHMVMGEDRILRLTVGDMKSAIREVCPATDFPEGIVGHDWKAVDQIPQAQLHKLLTAVAHCISTEETRYYLNGIYLHTCEGKLRGVATDGHRMAVYDTDTAWPSRFKAILHHKSVAILARKMARSNEVVTVSATVEKDDIRRLRIEADGWTMMTKIIDGTFPDYTRVIPPKDDTIQTTISYAAIRRFPVFEHRMGVTIHPDAKVMSVTSPDGNTVEMPVTGQGGPFGFNLYYLLDLAKRTTALRIEGKDASAPFRILTDDPNLLQVLMPRRM